MVFLVQRIKVTGKISALKFGWTVKYKKSQAILTYWKERKKTHWSHRLVGRIKW